MHPSCHHHRVILSRAISYVPYLLCCSPTLPNQALETGRTPAMSTTTTQPPPCTSLPRRPKESIDVMLSATTHFPDLHSLMSAACATRSAAPYLPDSYAAVAGPPGSRSFEKNMFNTRSIAQNVVHKACCASVRLHASPLFCMRSPRTMLHSASHGLHLQSFIS